jgi:hypothetical protein
VKFFSWRNEPQWIATAHAESVAQARELLLGEVGGIDGSCVVRAKARQIISEEAPEIWMGPNAEFALTDSAELRELAKFLEKVQGQVQDATTETARRCAEMVKRGADIQRQYAENTKRENRWTEKEMSVSESGVEAYLTAANALDFLDYQIRREFGLLTTPGLNQEVA